MVRTESGLELSSLRGKQQLNNTKVCTETDMDLQNKNVNLNNFLGSCCFHYYGKVSFRHCRSKRPTSYIFSYRVRLESTNDAA